LKETLPLPLPLDVVLNQLVGLVTVAAHAQPLFANTSTTSVNIFALEDGQLNKFVDKELMQKLLQSGVAFKLLAPAVVSTWLQLAPVSLTRRKSLNPPSRRAGKEVIPVGLPFIHSLNVITNLYWPGASLVFPLILIQPSCCLV
jgi:hypothetical protein